jgi:hypothetical protein
MGASSMKMNTIMEHCWNDTKKEKPNYSEKTLQTGRQKRRNRSGVAVRVITCIIIIIIGRKNKIYTALKVPRQCPLVLLVKVGWKQGEALGSEGSMLGVDSCEYVAEGKKTVFLNYT